MTRAERNCFCCDFCNGVQDKLTSLTRIVENRRQEAGLVPLSVYVKLRNAAEAAYLRNHKVGKNSWWGSLIDREHFDNGYRDGLQASIHRGVEVVKNGRRRLIGL